MTEAPIASATEPPVVFRFGSTPSPEVKGVAPETPDKPGPAAGPEESPAPRIAPGTFVFGAAKTADEDGKAAKMGTPTKGQNGVGTPSKGSPIVRQNRKFRRSRGDTPKATPPPPVVAPAPAPPAPQAGRGAAGQAEEPLHYIDEFTNELKGGAPSRPPGTEVFGTPPPVQRERVIRRFKRPTSSNTSPSKDLAGQLSAQAVKQAIELKKAGNKLHQEKKFLQASIQYQDALSLLPGAGSQPPGDPDSASQAWVSCQLNMVACQLAQNEWSAAELRASQILECSAVAADDVHSRMKAHYRRARARMELDKLDPAWEDLQSAMRLSPNDSALQGLRSELGKKRTALAAKKPSTTRKPDAGGVSVADAIHAKQATDNQDKRVTSHVGVIDEHGVESVLPTAQLDTSIAPGTDGGLSAENVLKRLTLDSPEQFGQILELAVLRKMKRLGLHEMINIMTTDDLVPGGLPVALGEARRDLRESVADEYKAFVFSFMQIEMQLLPGTQLQPTAARVRVNEVVDGLNQLAERLAAGEAFDMSCYDLAVVEGFKTLVRTGPAMTRLHCATSRGSTKEVREMLTTEGLECDLEATTESGYTPLVVAILEGQFEVCKMLIEEFGADVNSKGPCGQSLLHYACATVQPDEQLTLVRLLVEGGAEVNARDANGVTCLHLACMGLNKPLTQLFISHGADLHARSNDGVTPQQAADRWGAPPRGIKSFKSFFQLCVKKSKKDRGSRHHQDHSHSDSGADDHSSSSGSRGGHGASNSDTSSLTAALSPSSAANGAAEAADAMAAALIMEEEKAEKARQQKANKKKKQKQKKQQEKERQKEEERLVREEADKLRAEEERARQAERAEKQRIKQEKQQAAQRKRQQQQREEQEARQRAREAAERAEAAARQRKEAKEKAARERAAKEAREKAAREARERTAREARERAAAREAQKAAMASKQQEPSQGVRKMSLREKALARQKGKQLNNGTAQLLRSTSEEEAPSPTCPSTPLAGLSALPLPPGPISPPQPPQPAPTWSTPSPEERLPAWASEEKTVVAGAGVDIEMTDDDADISKTLPNGLLDSEDPPASAFSSSSRSANGFAGSTPTGAIGEGLVDGGSSSAGWGGGGSPREGSPRYEHAIGSMVRANAPLSTCVRACERLSDSAFCGSSGMQTRPRLLPRNLPLQLHRRRPQRCATCLLSPLFLYGFADNPFVAAVVVTGEHAPQQRDRHAAEALAQRRPAQPAAQCPRDRRRLARGPNLQPEHVGNASPGRIGGVARLALTSAGVRCEWPAGCAVVVNWPAGWSELPDLTFGRSG